MKQNPRYSSKLAQGVVYIADFNIILVIFDSGTLIENKWFKRNRVISAVLLVLSCVFFECIILIKIQNKLMTVMLLTFI